MVRLLAEHGAYVEVVITPAFIAARHGHAEVVRGVVAEVGANFETQDD